MSDPSRFDTLQFDSEAELIGYLLDEAGSSENEVQRRYWELCKQLAPILNDSVHRINHAPDADVIAAELLGFWRAMAGTSASLFATAFGAQHVHDVMESAVDEFVDLLKKTEAQAKEGNDQ